jgi:hypothetical protein
MTSRALVRVDAQTLERLAFNTGHDITLDNANLRAFLTIGPTTFVTELTPEAEVA